MLRKLLTLLLLGWLNASVAAAPPVILLFGPPGAGKGSFSQLATGDWGYNHLSTGDMLRDEIARKTPLGRIAEDVVRKGEYLEPTIVWAMVKERIRLFCQENKPFIIDGFGKTAEDMEALFEMLKEFQVDSATFVLFLDADDTICKQRISGRLVCGECHSIYNTLISHLASGEKCPHCLEGFLEQRINDTTFVVEKRVGQYRESIEKNQKISLERFPSVVFDAGQDESTCKRFYQELLERFSNQK
jgi:adenylate kinase